MNQIRRRPRRNSTLLPREELAALRQSLIAERDRIESVHESDLASVRWRRYAKN
jgi:hypothetical protein